MQRKEADWGRRASQLFFCTDASEVALYYSILFPSFESNTKYGLPCAFCVYTESYFTDMIISVISTIHLQPSFIWDLKGRTVDPAPMSMQCPQRFRFLKENSTISLPPLFGNIWSRDIRVVLTMCVSQVDLVIKARLMHGAEWKALSLPLYRMRSSFMIDINSHPSSALMIQKELKQWTGISKEISQEVISFNWKAQL